MEVAVAYIKVLSRNFTGQTEENHNKTESR
jgi:hypothetical protein